MPEFCYSCGRLGHAVKECWFDKSLFKRARTYGPWLRASSSGKKGGGRFPVSDQMHFASKVSHNGQSNKKIPANLKNLLDHIQT
ncbi:hypothetical protein GQ457_06G031920 [Hibiscus cannabinus]